MKKSANDPLLPAGTGPERAPISRASEGSDPAGDAKTIHDLFPGGLAGAIGNRAAICVGLAPRGPGRPDP